MGSLAAVACAAVLLLLSPQVMEAASLAAEVFTRGVLPALFPLMVLNGLAVNGSRTPAGKRRGARLAATVLLSLLAGSPASAQRVAGDCQDGLVRQRELPALLAATGVMSPMFFLGTLAARTGSRAACAGMLAAHWLAALLVGALLWGRERWRERQREQRQEQRQKRQREQRQERRQAMGHGRRMRKKNSQGQPAQQTARMPTEPLSPPSPAGRSAPLPRKARPAGPPSLWLALPGAVTAAAQALLSVCGAMMLFSVVACALRALVALLLPDFAPAQEQAFAALWALLEIGGGTFAVLDAFPTPPWPLLCALCSFGGLSICLQNLLFVGEKIRPGKLLCIRGLHGAVAYVICGLLGSFPFRVFP